MDYEGITGISYSRVGPLDPRRLQTEASAELSPAAADGAAGPARHRQRRRLRRLRVRRAGGRFGGRQQ